MKSGWLKTMVTAIFGGVIGAMVVLFFGQRVPTPPDSFEKLKVKELVVSDKMLLWEDGKTDADLLIQKGGIFARTRIIATQICGNAILGNVVFTTPDDPTKPLEKCAIYTEMASRPNEGGIFTVRSPRGGHLLTNPSGVTQGLAYTVAFDANDNPGCFIRKNATNEMLLASFQAPQQNIPVPNATVSNTQMSGHAQSQDIVPPSQPYNELQSAQSTGVFR